MNLVFEYLLILPFLSDKRSKAAQSIFPKPTEKIKPIPSTKAQYATCLRPARSPDLNPIENIFHLIKKKLAKQALNLQIEKESFEEFKTRVLRCCNDIDPLIIDRTIESLPKRIDAILKGRGCRTKY